MATIFNINDKHVAYVKALLKQKDLIIIHGDGLIFANNNGENYSYSDDNTGELTTVPQAEHGSMVHKVYHSGYDNREAVARAGYRAIYRKGDTAPETVQDIEKAFMKQIELDMAKDVTSKPVQQSNIFSVDGDEPVKAPKVKKAKDIEASQI
jgi:hypothetical protein